MLKIIIPALAVAGICVLGFIIDTGDSPRQAERPLRAQSTSIFATGRIEGLCPEIELRPQLAGRILSLPVREGQHVTADQLLLRLDDAQYREQVAAAEADLQRAEAELQRLIDGARPEERQEAEANYRARQEEVQRLTLRWERISKLREAQAVSQQEADDQISQLRAVRAQADAAQARLQLLTAPAREDEVLVARARIAAAQAEVALAKERLGRASVHAPRAGEILAVHLAPGELAGPEMVEPAIVMADTTKFQARAFVEEIDAARVKVGMTAKISAEGLRDRELTGRVTRLSPRMSSKQLHSHQAQERLDTKVREVWIELDRGENLVVVMPVDVTIDPSTASAAEARPSVGPEVRIPGLPRGGHP